MHGSTSQRASGHHCPPHSSAHEALSENDDAISLVCSLLRCLGISGITVGVGRVCRGVIMTYADKHHGTAETTFSSGLISATSVCNTPHRHNQLFYSFKNVIWLYLHPVPLTVLSALALW
jgi:hypothetical protein